MAVSRRKSNRNARDWRPLSGTAQSLNQAIAQVVASLAPGRLGFEAAILSVADFQALSKTVTGVELVPTTDRVELLRQVKDDREVAEIREAIGFAEDAFQMLRPQLREGASEKEIADLMEANLRRCGATGSSFPPIVAVGRRAALPHARPTETAGSAMTILSSSTGERLAGPIKVT